MASYRKKYAAIKIVEMDLDRSIQALKLLYKVYWEEKNFVDFDEFYRIYKSDLEVEIEAFRRKIGMCSDCFHKGLEARIYRTWASIVTQIHAGYVAESVFGKGTVSMNEDLDHSGIDILVEYGDTKLNYQIKKNSHRADARKRPGSKKKNPGIDLDLNYEVIDSKYFENPRTLKGELRAPYKRFSENPNLLRLPNGFVVFTKTPFELQKYKIDKIKKA